MPPLGLSAGLRKAGELGRREVSLAFTRPAMVVPAAHYPPRPQNGILVLQRGENPSTDYYLRSRLEEAKLESFIADISSRPRDCPLLRPDGPQALLVVFCRYASEPWLNALQRASDRLARVAFFMDDDLPAVVADEALPRTVRGKVALHFGAYEERLSALCSEVWVSTDALAARYPQSRPALLPPLPEADPPQPQLKTPPRVVYHGTDVHAREQAFVLEIAQSLQRTHPEAVVELIGGEGLRRSVERHPNVRVSPQLPWPEHCDRQRRHGAAVSLAPLMPSAVNAARAPVKAFDAARLGAAGIYADAEPYRGFVRDRVDGRLLPMEAQAWAVAIGELLDNPGRRLQLARTAWERMIALRRADHPLPPPPAA